MWGIDISKWQGDFDLADSAAEFVIIKAGGSDDGIYIDSQFLNNYTKAKNLNLPVGIYWYTSAISVTNLKSEVEYLYDHIKGLQFELPIFLDLEEMHLYDKAAQLALEWISNWSQRGYYPGIYTSYSWWTDTLTSVIDVIIPSQRWLALWMSGTDPDWPCGIWQNGHVEINGLEVDSDYMFEDYSFIKETGLNGFKKQKTFSDVPKSRSDYRAIMWGAANGYIVGYKDGTFRPDQPVTRGQLMTILWRMAGRPDAD